LTPRLDGPITLTPVARAGFPLLMVNARTSRRGVEAMSTIAPGPIRTR